VEARVASNEEVKQVLEGKKNLPLLPLALSMVGCATQEEMNHNLSQTIERGYVPINDHLDKYAGTCSLVGSGPSIQETYLELTGDVCAINSSIRFLTDKGIVPKWAMLWDAADIVAKFVVPDPRITYLVGSRCHPDVFKALEGCPTIVWHAGGDHNINEMILKNGLKEPLVNGGSAGVTRGMYLVSALGYRDLHIFGADSSYSDDGKTHITGSLVPEKDIMVSVGNEPPKWFRTTPEWCAQVEEYRCIYAMFTFNDNHKVEVHGNGMFKYMHEVLKAKKKEMGQEKFIENISAQEAHRQELSRLASQPAPVVQPEVKNASV
jgi:hypothetical protein